MDETNPKKKESYHSLNHVQAKNIKLIFSHMTKKQCISTSIINDCLNLVCNNYKHCRIFFFFFFIKLNKIDSLNGWWMKIMLGSGKENRCVNFTQCYRCSFEMEKLVVGLVEPSSQLRKMKILLIESTCLLLIFQDLLWEITGTVASLKNLVLQKLFRLDPMM